MEIYISVMAGFVLGFFLLVGEVAALRKRVPVIGAYLRRLHQSGKRIRLFMAICGILTFFLIQPVVIAALVVSALSNLNAHFSANFMHELKLDTGHAKLLFNFSGAV